MSTTPYYPTDLTEAQWTLLLDITASAEMATGRSRASAVRSAAGAQWDSGICSRRAVSGGCCHGSSASGIPSIAYFKSWRQKGVWAKLMEALRQCERRRQGRQVEPSAGRVDSQSIKTATQATEVGFDGGKQVKGRKRHLLVDTLGLLIAVVVTAANTDDRVGLMILLTQYFVGGVRRLRKLWVDGGYQAEWLAQWVTRLETHA